MSACLHYNLPKEERSDLDRYLKNLAMKTTQVICQARLGEKVKTACEPNPSLRNYWVRTQNRCARRHIPAYRACLCVCMARS